MAKPPIKDTPEPLRFMPKSVVKQEFGRRVYQRMLKKGWNQSDLGREADMPRDSISTYVRGKALPTPVSLRKLAQALDCTENELLPEHVERAIDDENPQMEMKVSHGQPGMAWLRVNQLVPTGLAVQILGLLQNQNDAAHR